MFEFKIIEILLQHLGRHFFRLCRHFILELNLNWNCYIYHNQIIGIYSGYGGIVPSYGVGLAGPAYAHGIAPAYGHGYAPALARPALLARPAVAAAVPGTLLGNITIK